LVHLRATTHIFCVHAWYVLVARRVCYVLAP
jgi:hypothetical protein